MGAVTAGAVAVDGDEEATSSFDKRGRTGATSDFQDVDAMAKYGGRSSRRATGVPASKPGAESLSGPEAQAADEVRRRKDPRASAQERSFLVRNAAATAGTVGIAADVDVDVEESSEDYRKRMDAKIEEMEMEMSHTESDRSLSAEKIGPNPAEDSDNELAEKSEPFGIEDSDKDQTVEDAGAAQTENVAARGLTRPPDVEYGEIPGEDGSGLAVAVAVDEENEPMLPAAIEYDPDAKPPIYRNRRFRLYAFTGVIVLIAVIVGVVVGVVTQVDQAQEPTAAPTTILEGTYREQFVKEVGEQVNVAGSPHDRAANWIMFEDPLHLEPEAPNLLQRYQLALFYFLTTNNGQKRWNSCNPPLENEDDSCVYKDPQFVGDTVETLVYKDTPGKIRWMAGTHECDWWGAFCDPTQNLIALEVSK
jgi:hypothetical protein